MEAPKPLLLHTLLSSLPLLRPLSSRVWKATNTHWVSKENAKSHKCVYELGMLKWCWLIWSRWHTVRSRVNPLGSSSLQTSWESNRRLTAKTFSQLALTSEWFRRKHFQTFDALMATRIKSRLVSPAVTLLRRPPVDIKAAPLWLRAQVKAKATRGLIKLTCRTGCRTQWKPITWPEWKRQGHQTEWTGLGRSSAESRCSYVASRMEMILHGGEGRHDCASSGASEIELCQLSY